MESWSLWLWRRGSSAGSFGVGYRRLCGACGVEGTSGSRASCSNADRTLCRSLLGMGGSTALVVRGDRASWACSLVVFVWVPS